ncbi:MAG: hypothetical protein J6R95_03380, partial [Bacteroidales bacterium]|nr:hypothetical protein [Bacteroidales bacterium]
ILSFNDAKIQAFYRKTINCNKILSKNNKNLTSTEKLLDVRSNPSQSFDIPATNQGVIAWRHKSSAIQV